MVCAAAPLPQTGEHYFEVTFDIAGTKYNQSDTAVGLWCAPKPCVSELMTRHGKPFWGLRGDRDADALRVQGKGSGKVGLNSSGWAISSGDNVGVLVNMDTASMTFFRDGQPIPGAIIHGFEKTDARIAVSCVGSVTLTHKRREDGQDQASATL